jgi:hypothetical protein
MLDNLHTQDAVGGEKPFPDYPFARGLVEALGQHRILIVAKSRQMLATWTVCGFLLQRTLQDPPGIRLVLSKGARDSAELIKRLKVMVRHLPEGLGAGVKVMGTEVRFPGGGRIISLPATEFAARMHSPTVVFWDEMAFTPNSEGIWAAVKPAVDSGGSFVGVSTPNGTDNAFYRLYSDESTGFGKLKLHYKQHPERGEEWESGARQGLSEARWRQEYEVDFEVLADRVYDEFDPNLHILKEPFTWRRDAGRTFRSIDFGYHHPYVVWGRLSPEGDLTIFSEWEGDGATVDQLAAAIRAIEERLQIEEKDITWTAGDPAGAARSDTGISPVERLKELGFKVIWRQSEILTGVELVKSMLRDAAGQVRLRFAREVEKTIYHLRHYRWEPGTDRPLKDGAHDHAMDALRYLIVNLQGQKPVSHTGGRVVGAKW